MTIPNEDAPNKSHVCVLCKKTFASAGSLRSHVNNTHPTKLEFHLTESLAVIVPKSDSTDTFVCPISDCQRSYSTLETFRKHTTKYHPGTSVSNTLKNVRTNNEEPPQAKRQKMMSPAFSKDNGCHAALKLETRTRSTLTAASLDCLPVAFHMDHGTLNQAKTLFGIVNADDLKDAQLHLPWSSSTTTSPLTTVLQLHTNETNIVTNSLVAHNQENAPRDLTEVTLRQIISKSPLPHLLDKLGTLVEPSPVLLKALNTDFRQCPSLVQAVATLHTGALIFDNEVVLILAAEVYGRSKSQDTHGEVNLASLPQANECAYPSSLLVGLVHEADGHGMKKKLKIGSKTMNMLVTMGARLPKDQCIVDIGPSSSAKASSLRPTHTRIFYQEAKVKKFLDCFHNHSLSDPVSDDDSSAPTITVSALRQLTTAFDHPSTFTPWRSVLGEFDADLTLPSTVFTVCDMPHQSYGSSSTATEKIASQFLQALAWAYLKPSAKMIPDFANALETFHAVQRVRKIKNMNGKDWSTLDRFVTSLEKVIAVNGPLEARALAMICDFGSAAKLASSKLSDCNDKVKENVVEKLYDLFGV
ncbi:hypothetical protein DM01DRAFT_1336027 [Hesseltinella vesiculosa]|uniref:C2H2-type domain-containing protein n=1 Tax=Hesseltinella vesiculosa TaxID=101127 RepID=A0A1X2GHS1_9FUNG|nr:hypothetical protein DM01DRAFT_1336027 [Hesseltinella vesiculosa]